MAHKIVAAFYFVFCLYLFVANVVVDADRHIYLACAAVPDGTFVRSTRSCRHYYLCKNENVVHETKCPDKYLFSDVKQLCDFDKFVNCNSCLEYGRPYFADPKNCSKYFRCINGLRRTFNCPYDQMFDEISNTCQISRDVECKNVDDIPSVDSTEQPPGDPDWPVPDGSSTRPPPTWGAPQAPQGGFNNDYEEEEDIEIETTTRRPGGVGTWHPTTDPDAPPTTTTRDPWGPPDSPIGGGNGGGNDEEELNINN